MEATVSNDPHLEKPTLNSPAAFDEAKPSSIELPDRLNYENRADSDLVRKIIRDA